MAKNSLSLPDNLVQLLAAADQAKHFPPGTMASLLQQEVGGQADRFVADPTTPHYAPGPDGKRKSSAFGPFGLLESTAADPGYGVAPLGDKTNLAEHVRFAADYLDARSRSAGSLAAGLAGYGEGEKYAQQVARRRDGAQMAGPDQAPAPVVLAQAAAPAPVPAPIVLSQNQATPLPAPADPEKDIWTQYTNGVQTEMAKRFAPAVAAPAAAPVARPPIEMPAGPLDYQTILASDVGNRANFGLLQGLGRLGRKPA